MQKVHLKRTKRLLAGHLWVFSNEIAESLKHYLPGSLVEFFDAKDAFLGVGYINPHSLIAARVLSRDKAEIGEDFLRARIKDAIVLRERLIGDISACRLIFSESDFLPGLVVDKYGDCIVIQILTFGMESLKDIVIRVLDDLLNPRVIVLRNDSRVRELEGLPLFKEVIKGSLEQACAIREGGLMFEVDPLEGQKTGYFLDQRDNRSALAGFVKGGRGLDLFSYTGAWGLRLAKNGASVTLVDDSERALEGARRNAELNGVAAEFEKANVFEYLKIAPEKESYDFVILDPPALVKSASKLKEAEKAYRKLNSLAIGLLKPGGILATSSCSHHMGREMFLNMLVSAGRDSGRRLRLIYQGFQAPDHPVLIAMPETEYLKCVFLVAD